MRLGTLVDTAEARRCLRLPPLRRGQLERNPAPRERSEVSLSGEATETVLGTGGAPGIDTGLAAVSASPTERQAS